MAEGGVWQTEAPETAARLWLEAFGAALESGDVAAAVKLFLPDGHWRDVLAFTWHFRTVSGADAIAALLRRRLAKTRPSAFRLAPGRTPPRQVRRAGAPAIEAIFAFETAVGRGSGVVRLAPSPEGDGLRAWTLFTALDELKGHEERIGPRRPKGESYSRDFGGENWLDQRLKARAYADRDPAVLIVGGGQAGLALAARLGALGVDALIVDRIARVGDNWRKRYHALTLHNQVHVNHLPYMPFPETWPVYIPKDKLANWFEAYVEAMELNFWTGTEFLGGAYDEREGRWTVRLGRADGGERVMRPRHLVFATGVSGIPNVPDLPGLKEFRGAVMHSSAYEDGAAWKGRRALVVGTGNSGHDVAQDLCSAGAEVTIVQRSPTTVVGIEPSGQLVYALYSEGPSTDDCDLLSASFPYPVLHRSHQLATQEMLRHDRELLAKLAAKGFRMDIGEDETGFLMKYLRRGGGYYLNVGCSDLIIEGRIGLLQYDDIERFAPEGARLRDGRLIPADLIVLATGYKPQQEAVRRYLGDEIADRVGPIWGFDEGGELRNMWKRTAQPGLWFIAGSLAQCRIYSRYLALQLKACELGMLSPSLPADADEAEVRTAA